MLTTTKHNKSFWLAALLLIANFALAATSSLSFTTDPQSIAAGAISSKLNVTTGDVFGETSDLYLISSSPTGEFSSSDTSWESVSKLTWNSNYANRSFYYRDSNAGTYTITAKLVGRTSGTTLIATQAMAVGGGGPAPATTTASTPTITNSVPVETVARPRMLGSIKLHVPGSVGLHAQKYYWAETEHSEAVPDLFWNFGDGTSISGTGGWHSYDHVGRYILSVRSPALGPQATARSVVEVTELQVHLASARSGLDGFVELVNPNPNDFDVGSYKLVSAGRVFDIPEDTFVIAGGSAYFSNHKSGLNISDGFVKLEAPDGASVDSLDINLRPGVPTVLGTSTLPTLVPLQRPAVHKIMAKPLTPVVPAMPTSTPTSTSKIVVTRHQSLFSRLLSFFR